MPGYQYEPTWGTEQFQQVPPHAVGQSMQERAAAQQLTQSQQAQDAARQAAHAAQQAAQAAYQAAEQASQFEQQAMEPTQFQQPGAGQMTQQQAQPAVDPSHGGPSLSQPGPAFGQTQPGQAFQQQATPQQTPATNPHVDIYESSDEITVFADIPGARSEDLRLEGDQRTLRISATSSSEELDEGVTPIQQERARRAERTIELPADVDVEGAEATCENGVCRVSLPKARQSTIGVQ